MFSRTFAHKKYLSAILIGCLVSCGGGGSSVDSTVKTGYFIDSAVSGLEYSCGSINGISGEDGSFLYEKGKPVTFKIGRMVLGSVIVNHQRVFPIDLISGATDESNPNATLMAQILQTLDSDGDPSNGISITESTRKAITQSIEVATNDPSQTSEAIHQLLAAATANRTTGPATVLVEEATAKTHMKSNLLKEYVGEWSGKFSGNEAGICNITIGLSDDETTSSVTGFCAVTVTPPIVDPDQNQDPFAQVTINHIDTASLQSNGEFSGTLDNSAVFSGSFNRNGTMSGEWTRSIYGGAWKMSKQ